MDDSSLTQLDHFSASKPLAALPKAAARAEDPPHGAAGPHLAHRPCGAVFLGAARRWGRCLNVFNG